jgi:GTP-binding protein
MDIIKAEYTASYVREDQCPKDGKKEFAFIGRSNVGKSSLINMLTTQKLNYFIIDEAWYLVDLPGYGFAKVSKTTREEWSRMIKYFLRVREPLCTAFVLIDSRQIAQKVDIEFLNWCGSNGVPITIVYTKCDKVNDYQLQKNIGSLRSAMLETWEELPQEFFTSANNNLGREEILAYIGEIL